MKTKSIQTWLPTEAYQDFCALARSRNTTHSELLRETIIQMLDARAVGGEHFAVNLPTFIATVSNVDHMNRSIAASMQYVALMLDAMLTAADPVLAKRLKADFQAKIGARHG